MYRLKWEQAGAYDVHLATGVLDDGNPLLRDVIGSRRALVVTDPAVDALHGGRLRTYLEGLPVAVHVVDLTERRKTMATVLDICAAAQLAGIGRRDFLVAFGGGVCCDAVSVAASLIRRGIPYLCLPTTLVGQIDAGIGLKGGVNFGGSKNYLGCFRPPSGVLIDPSLLRSLPATELSAGMAEALKMALVLDADLFSTIKTLGPTLIRSGFAEPSDAGPDVIARTITLMLDELALNPFEDRVLERLVDFGHTFSPRLEELSEYGLKHGVAVALDMALSSALAVELGLLSSHDFEEVVAALVALNLPVHSALCTPADLGDAMRSAEAHRDGRLNLVLPTGIGSATFVRHRRDVPAPALAAALHRLARAARRNNAATVPV